MELNEQHTTVNIVKFFKFSEEQRLVLRDFYAKNQYPNKQEIENLSSKFGCTKKQINSWFTNTRQVMRKRNDKKSEDSNNFDDEHLESSSEECEVIDAKQENFKEVMPEDQAESINEAPKNVMVSRNFKKKVQFQNLTLICSRFGSAVLEMKGQKSRFGLIRQCQRSVHHYFLSIFFSFFRALTLKLQLLKMIRMILINI